MGNKEAISLFYKIKMQGIIEIAIMVIIVVVVGTAIGLMSNVNPLKDSPKSAPEPESKKANHATYAFEALGNNKQDLSDSELLFIAGAHQAPKVSLSDYVSSSYPIKAGMYMGISNEGLFINDKDTLLSRNTCRAMVTNEGQILLGAKLDKCLERGMVKDGIGDIRLSSPNPIVRSKKWIIKGKAILDPTENFCLGVIDNRLKLLSMPYIKENNIFNKISSWDFKK
jgi:hypothetical protein